MSGQRPDFTPAQKIAAAAAGIPVVSNLLAAFGVWAPNAPQQDALGDAVTWGGVLAAALIAGDTGVRAARNAADAKRDAATAVAASAIVANGTADMPAVGMAAVDPETGLGELPLIEDPEAEGEIDLPDDETEFADPEAAAIAAVVAAEVAADPDRPAL